MTPYTITIYLSDDQQRQLEAITEAVKQQLRPTADPATTFNMIMQTGIAHVIDERFAMWDDQLKRGRQQE